ncbi:MAG: hypothetical protein BGO67_10210 [Alphaproteobacteria bacterium 41-28]|nr:MAG: hypothetical protein BGO67_10210 [Alphaproteobacteria bacterium 41-28]
MISQRNFTSCLSSILSYIHYPLFYLLLRLVLFETLSNHYYKFEFTLIKKNWRFSACSTIFMVIDLYIIRCPISGIYKIEDSMNKLLNNKNKFVYYKNVSTLFRFTSNHGFDLYNKGN